ncbi:hypothetical protein [Nostoc sp. ChiVER01]|uniref:hypothetical protein n=1 Tax=Nostoc sp. ChiVER01 TaxID=3075382 RepID=UPI002AD56533|nr:hypothetical protein [Nostoc sp. ChiVER01]MDZ8221839.1 hypothetical protein [Nostoc sp. ChiVER01]
MLTLEQKQQFVEKGYVLIEGGIKNLDLLAKMREQTWERIGYDPHNQETWINPYVEFEGTEAHYFPDMAPRVCKAIGELVGGLDRVDIKSIQYLWNRFAVKYLYYPDSDEGQWQLPETMWHRDGGYFLNFLDSPETVLVPLVLGCDIESHGGATIILPESVSLIARFLAQHPEGVYGWQHLRPHYPIYEIAASCKEYVELIGKMGDVYLMHGFMVHAGGYNYSGKPVYVMNSQVSLKEPLNLSSKNPSLLEQATLRALGVSSFDFKPTAPRKRFPLPKSDSLKSVS